MTNTKNWGIIKQAQELNKIKIKEQTAAEILTTLMFVVDMKQFNIIFDKLMELYHLKLDPFTKTPCTIDQYLISKCLYDEDMRREEVLKEWTI